MSTQTSTGNVVINVEERKVIITPVGETGTGVAAGGTTNQALVKLSNNNFDTGWRNVVVELSGDGVDNTNPMMPTLTFPTPDEIGAYSNTNPDGFVDASGAANAAPVQSVNGDTGNVSVFDGGVTGDILVKNSNTNYDTSWTDSITVDKITYDTTAAETVDTIGQTAWDADARTLAINKGNGVIQNITQELNYAPARNTEATALQRGELVMVDPAQPAQGMTLRLKRYISNGTYPVDLFVGVVSETIQPNETGFVEFFGRLNNLSLSALQPSGETWQEGDILWPNPAIAGGMTRVEPSAPAHKVTVAAILRITGQNVLIQVRPNLRSRISDLHDVQVTNVSNAQILSWNGTAWVNTNNEADGVLSVTGDGVDNTDPQNPVLSFPTVDEIGAYSNTNPASYINVAQATAAAPIQSVTGTLVTGTSANPVINIPTVDQVGAYSNTNPANYINVAQSIAAAPVQSVNGQTNVVVLDADDVGAYSNTNPAGYTNNTGTVTNVTAGSGLAGGSITTTGTISLSSNTINSLNLADSSLQPSDIGTGSNQIPLNQYLGDLAYTDADSIGNATISNANISNSLTVADAATISGIEGTLPTGDDSSVGSDLVAWNKFRKMLEQGVEAGTLYSKPILSTYSLVYTTSGAYEGGVLAPNGDIHFVPTNAAVGQKISLNGTVSTYSLVYTAAGAYISGVLAPNGDIHFVPYNANRGQKIAPDGVVSTYSLVYTTSAAYRGGVLAPNGDIHFVPYNTTIGQKISANGVVSTYNLAYTISVAYIGGVLAPNGDIHFVPYNGRVGQKIAPNGTLSTYSLIYTLVGAYAGGVLAPNGDIHFVPRSAAVGQKVSIDGTVSTYSLVYTTTNAYRGGVLAPNGDIHFIPQSAAVGQKVSIDGTVSTYSLVYTIADAYIGGVLAPNGDIHFVPLSANCGQVIRSQYGKEISIGYAMSPHFNKL